MINLAVFGTLAVLLVAAWFIVCMATRDTGNHSAGRERRRLRAAAGWVALALTHAIDAGSWAYEKIRGRIRRLHASPAAIPSAENPDPAHMDAMRWRPGGERPWEDDTGSFTKFVQAGE